jgi:hypothetical protein
MLRLLRLAGYAVVLRLSAWGLLLADRLNPNRRPPGAP